MATERLVIDPLTRIEGHLRIELEHEGGKITDAWSETTMYRGIETIVQGRDPRDVWAFVGRICGVCTGVHSVASVVAVASGLVIDEIVNPLQNSVIHLGLAAMPITVVCLVAYTNIFNLIDGLDGLASGIACIAGLTMWIVSTISGRLDAAVLAIMISGTTLAFLRYNFHPASIFLGDSGALLIGFALGTVSLLSVSRVSGLTAIIIPLVVAGIPIIDTFSAIVRRGRAHVSIGHADKGHIHHRLMSVGLGQRQTALVIYAWTAALCVGSVVMTQVEVFPRICIFVALVVASGAFASRLRLFRPVLLHHRDSKTGEDELVTPQDPAFEQEREKFDEQHHQLGE